MNIILYIIDALRADHLRSYGYERDTSNNIDSLASEGVRFANAFTQSTWTRPVAASLLTGVYPPVHGVRTREDTFNASLPRLPNILKEAGYVTAGFSAMGNVSTATNFDKGFDQFFDLYKEPSLIEKRPLTSTSDEDLLHEEATNVTIPRSGDINPYFWHWLDNEVINEENFFAFMWAIDPHIPYDPPPDFRKYVDDSYSGDVDGSRECLQRVNSKPDLQHLKDLYDSEIYYTDWSVGQLVQGLHDRGIYDDTLIIIAGDHGEAFYEHGWLVHGNLPFDELIRVPLILKFPKGQFKGDVSEPVELIDVFPTVLEMCGLRHEVEQQGQSVLPLIRGDNVEGREYVFSETQMWRMRNCFFSARTKNWKYIEIEDPADALNAYLSTFKYIKAKGLMGKIMRNPMYYIRRYLQTESELLFNLHRDPEERQNLARSNPQKKDELKNQLLEWRHECQELRVDSNGESDEEIDNETEEHLRQLGYLD